MTPSDSPPPSPPERLAGLIGRARAADGDPPFSDGALVELAHGEREQIWLGDAAALATATSAEFMVDPAGRGQGLGTRMLEHLLATGRTLFWAHGDHPAARALAASHGLRPVRELLHLVAPVPRSSPSSRPSQPFGGIRGGSAGETSPADPGRTPPEASDAGSPVFTMRAFTTADADAWVALNAGAFAGHPEQGAVTRNDLDTIMAEDWFDPEDFLLLDRGGHLAGYAWLKIEPGQTDAGEFYVVGVDPGLQGAGLGRELMNMGMARLAERDIPSAHLYVEADNVAALRLYESFGFTRRSIDVQYESPPAVE